MSSRTSSGRAAIIEFRGPAVDVAGNALSGFEGNGLRLARRIGALYI
jgi:hypothetical protein